MENFKGSIHTYHLHRTACSISCVLIEGKGDTMNTVKTTFLLTALTLLLLFIGKMLGGRGGMVVAFVVALVMNFGSYWFSDRIVLAMYRARQVDQMEAPQFHRIVSALSEISHLPMPKLYVIPTETPNAFATGRDPQHAACAVTQGILRLLNEDELEGVLAHEMAHIRNRDILISSIVATIAGAIFMLTYMARWAAIFGGGGQRGRRGGGIIELLALTIVAPIVAMLIQMAISRSREYQADESGSHICGKPRALASALRRLQAGVKRYPMEANPTTAHMFIVNPLTGSGILNLFSTHPSVESRIQKLEELAQRM